VWAGLVHDKLIGPFLFLEKIVTRRSCSDMLELYVLPQLPPQTIFQQNGAPSHFCYHVRNYLDREMVGRWLGDGSAEVDQSLGLLGRQT
jgi:hypothetical protein